MKMKEIFDSLLHKKKLSFSFKIPHVRNELDFFQKNKIILSGT